MFYDAESKTNASPSVSDKSTIAQNDP